MKKIIISLCATALLFAGSVSAQSMMGYQNNTTAITPSSNTNITTALQDIYASQNITSQDQLNCSRVSDDQFEKLGDAYMGAGITEAQHTAMENMMGGEGSATLKQAHINMGRAYVGCWSNYNSVTPTMSMMNGSHSNDYGPGMMAGWSKMMNGYYYGNFIGTTWLMMSLECIALVLGIIALALSIIVLARSIRKK